MDEQLWVAAAAGILAGVVGSLPVMRPVVKGSIRYWRSWRGHHGSNGRFTPAVSPSSGLPSLAVKAAPSNGAPASVPDRGGD
jgi:hypothetical protein